MFYLIRFFIPNLWLQLKNKAICLGAWGRELHILRVFKEPKKKKKGFKIKFHHCSLNYKLQLVKENNILIWKKKTPSTRARREPLNAVASLQTTLSAQAHIRSTRSIITLLKRLLLVIFYETSALFSYQQQRAFPLLSCLFFLLALITRELLFHTGPSQGEELFLLSIITEITWNRMGLPHKAPKALSVRSAPVPWRPAWAAPSEGHLVRPLSSGKMPFNSTNRGLTLKVFKEGHSLASCYWPCPALIFRSAWCRKKICLTIFHFPSSSWDLPMKN